MKPIRQSIVAVLVAAGVSAFTFWAPNGLMAPVLLENSPGVLILLDLLVGLANHLLPGFVVGFLATRRPVLLGAVVSAVVAFVALHYIASTSDQSISFLSAAHSFVSYFAFGAAGAALGVVFRGVRPNNSFKPKPLRGSA